jgi:hypothetical protein
VVGGIGGPSIRATKMGRLNVVMKQADGTQVRRVLYPVKYCLGATEQIWSLNQEVNDARLSTDDKHRYVLTYNDEQQTKIVFDRRAKTNTGRVPRVEVIQDTAEIGMFAKQTKTINEYHEELGHPNMVVTRSMAKARHENVAGPIQQCEDCAVGKAHQKRVPKQPVACAKNPGERLFLDISHPKQQSI